DTQGGLTTHIRTHTRRRGRKRRRGSNPVSSSSHHRQGDSDSTINDHRRSPHHKLASRPAPHNAKQSTARAEDQAAPTLVTSIAGGKRWTCVEPAPEPTTRLVSSSPRKHLLSSSDFRKTSEARQPLEHAG
uniref:Uncharacterized protein n=1 Tax=Triticum urartu TaxID=4572 RepID=A0A8R7QFK4_TRIUA